SLKTANSSSVHHCGPCPQEWFSYSNSCYYSSDEKKTWSESVAACAAENASLLLIEHEEEMRFLRSISLLSWVGVSRKSSEHPWMTIKGSRYTPNVPAASMHGASACLTHAEMHDHREHHPEWRLDSRGKRTRDSPLPRAQVAAEVLGLVCLVLVSTVVKTAVLIPCKSILKYVGTFNALNSVNHCAPCPQEWFSYSDSCYYLSDERTTWSESMEACAAKNASLLLMDHEEE
ncbi:NKG2-C type II integral membrane protein, partial [Galemys pyrenaicus]